MMDTIKSQFGHPRGVMGWVVGQVLAMENRERITWAVDQLGIQPADHVLEIGFGPGVGIQKAAACATSGRVAGVDVSAVMVRQASNRNAKAVRAGKVDLHEGDARSLPFDNATFDKAFAINALHHWADAAAGLTEIKRVLKPGGQVSIIEQPPQRITEEAVMRKRGAEIIQALEEAGFSAINPIYKELQRGWLVYVLATR
jgi:ubiquinone/menaquinone biosynthesis C-methylase UbiE